ncbi:MAG: contractile injection system tape measure protein [Gammaproteobacteria bacterium]
MAKSHHAVGELCLDLQFPTEQLALEVGDEVLDLARRDLMERLNRVFDDYDLHDSVVHLDKLQLDLGDVAVDALRAQLGDRFESRLREILQRQIPLSATNAPGACRSDETEAEIRLVQHFLNTGELPWYATRGRAAALPAMLVAILRARSSTMTAFMRDAPTKTLQRLFRSLNVKDRSCLFAVTTVGSVQAGSNLARALNELLKVAAVPEGRHEEAWLTALRFVLTPAAFRSQSISSAVLAAIDRPFSPDEATTPDVDQRTDIETQIRSLNAAARIAIGATASAEVSLSDDPGQSTAHQNSVPDHGQLQRRDDRHALLTEATARQREQWLAQLVGHRRAAVRAVLAQLELWRPPEHRAVGFNASSTRQLQLLAFDSLSVGVTSGFDLPMWLDGLLRLFARYHDMRYLNVLASFHDQIVARAAGGSHWHQVEAALTQLLERAGTGRPAEEASEQNIRAPWVALDVLRDVVHGRGAPLSDREQSLHAEVLDQNMPLAASRLCDELDAQRMTVNANVRWVNGRRSAANGASDLPALMALLRSGPYTKGRSSGVGNAHSPSLSKKQRDREKPGSEPDSAANDLVTEKDPTAVVGVARTADSTPARDGSFTLAQALIRLGQFGVIWPEHLVPLLTHAGQERPARDASTAEDRRALEIFVTQLLEDLPGLLSGAQDALPDTPSMVSDRSSGSQAVVSHLLKSLRGVRSMSEQGWSAALIHVAQKIGSQHDAALIDALRSGRRRGQSVDYVGEAVAKFDADARQCDSIFLSYRHMAALVNSLSEQALGRVLSRLTGYDYVAVRKLGDVIASAARIESAYLSAAAIRRIVWREMFDWFSIQGRPFQVAPLARALTTALIGEIRHVDVAEFVARLNARLPRDARAVDWLGAVMPASVAMNSSHDAPQVDALAAIENHTEHEQEANMNAPVYIENAGLVILAPYFPRLFEMLALTHEGQFHSDEHAHRAACILQLCVDDEVEPMEFDLALNKILCGIERDQPLAQGLRVSQPERDAVKSLMDATRNNWSSLGQTSREGLRESFLRREGVLQHTDNGWRLRVAERPFDMLIDSIPWTFRVVRYPWMAEVLHVEWR